MRRLLRVLAPLVVLVSSVAVSSSAGATLPDPPTCAGMYNFTLSAPMTFPGVGPSTSVGFQISPIGSFCASWSSWPADYPYGWISGWCGAATGWGQLPDGRWFDVVWAGSSLTIVGGPAGTYTVVPTSLDCTGGGGTPSFIAVGGTTATADACAGNGTMHFSWPSSGNFWFSFGIFVGTCATLTPFSASGTLTGSCSGGASGTGVTSDGIRFDVTWMPTAFGAGKLVLSGNVIGVVHANPDPFTTGCSQFITSTQLAKLR